MKSLFRERQHEHKHDGEVRAETAKVLTRHRTTLKKVRATLADADETLADEIKRLDSALRGGE